VELGCCVGEGHRWRGGRGRGVKGGVAQVYEKVWEWRHDGGIHDGGWKDMRCKRPNIRTIRVMIEDD
jgi:hypothetical protein